MRAFPLPFCQSVPGEIVNQLPGFNGSRIMKIVSILITISAVISGSIVRAESKPNILFIHMEDMGVQIPAYGDHTVATPNLDALASEGLVFERCHVGAATCASSRGTLFSGLYPHQNGIMCFVQQHGFHYREGIPTFVRTLRRKGYKTGITYKDGVESAHYEVHPVPFDFKPKYTENHLTGLVGKKAPEIKSNPPLASHAVDNFRYFLENLEEGKPFYFQAQTPDTHHLWNRDWFIRDGEQGWPYPDVDLSRVTTTPGWGEALVPEGKLRVEVGHYYRAIQRTDWYVGRILSLLEEFGHKDNTLVVFSADHGPSHLLRGKTTAHECGLRVPFIVRWPGKIKNPGTRVDGLVSFVDIYPTFVSAAGLKPPRYLPGFSLLPVFGGAEPRRKHLFSAYVGHTTGYHLYWPTRTVTDGKWKLTYHLFGDGRRQRYKDAKPEGLAVLHKQLNEMPKNSQARQLRNECLFPHQYQLFNLEADPHETNNLYGKKKHAMVQGRLTETLENWRKNSVDPFLDPEYVDRFTANYETNHELWKSLGMHKMKDKLALDFREFIPKWDPEPYMGKKDI